MSQQPTPPTEADLYDQIIDLRTDEDDNPVYIKQGQTFSVTLDFGAEALESTDIFSLPCWRAWGDENPVVTLRGKKAFKIDVSDPEHKKLTVSWQGDDTSLWPPARTEHEVIEMRGVLNHHDKDRAERGRSGKILCKWLYASTWDRS